MNFQKKNSPTSFVETVTDPPNIVNEVIIGEEPQEVEDFVGVDISSTEIDESQDCCQENLNSEYRRRQEDKISQLRNSNAKIR